jgi:hypothetical protein
MPLSRRNQDRRPLGETRPPRCSEEHRDRSFDLASHKSMVEGPGVARTSLLGSSILYDSEPFFVQSGGTHVTTLAAWVSISNPRPSACYLVSDSRISWPDGGGWNSGQKLFASRRFPDVFGYCGDVQFPTLALHQAVDFLDRGLLVAGNASSPQRHRRVAAELSEAYRSYPAHIAEPSTIVHFARDGEDSRSQFYSWRLDWSRSSPIKSTEIDLPTTSVLGLTLGSGWKVLVHRSEEWKKSQGRTARGVFSSFCDAISSGEDPRSGGPPQLAGLYTSGVGRMFGVIVDARRYVAGNVVTDDADFDEIEWRNNLFERMNPRTLKRLDGAQPQPRPKTQT